MPILRLAVSFLRAWGQSQSQLALENLALRQQLAILHRKSKRPKLRHRDRMFWIVLTRLWRDWRSALILVRPETVLRWHRQGFKYYWRWKSWSERSGRPRISPEVIALIRQLAQENRNWGVPRIHSELGLLGYDLAESTVAKYMPRRSPRPPSQSWRTFLRNHLRCTAACDFFVVPTATFRLLFCFVVLHHARRPILHVNVTDHPTAEWASLQMIEAFPGDGTEPRFLLRDRDGVYGHAFSRRVHGMGLREILTAPQSPWQNPYAERVIGSIRRECLNHLIVLNEGHLRRILREYVRYYNQSRPHLSLCRNSPQPRDVQPPSHGPVKAIPFLGGLHHRYTRAA